MSSPGNSLSDLGPARRLVRDIDRQFRIALARMSPEDRRNAAPGDVMHWLAAYDAKAKLCLQWNREGIRPEHVGLKQRDSAA